jgi:hypothetical protein
MSYTAPLSMFSSVTGSVTSVFFTEKDKLKPLVGSEEDDVVASSSHFGKRRQSIDAFHSPGTGSNHDDSTGNIEENKLKMHCLKCNGTVEGPKYSTCKCVVPTLTVDELNVTNVSSNSLTSIGMSTIGSIGSLSTETLGGLSKVSTASTDVFIGMFSKTTQLAGGVFKSSGI